jgi:outer membrane protein assembly factor BamB
MAVSLLLVICLSVNCIPIASLAEDGPGPAGAWSMLRGDARHSGCTPFNVSANEGGVRWTHRFNVRVDYSGGGAYTMAADGTVYMLSSRPSGIISISPDGTERMVLVADASHWGPVLGPDGTLYHLGLAEVSAYDPGGRNKWILPLGANITSSATVDAEGTVYVGTEDGNLSAISPLGSIVWKFWDRYAVRCCPAVGADGTVDFIGEWEDHQALISLHPDGTFRWAYPLEHANSDSAPAVGPDGTVYCYVPPDRLCAIAPNGTLRWAADVPHGVFDEHESWCMILFPVISPDGTVYSGSIDGLYSIAPDGMVIWRIERGHEVRPSAFTADGAILFTSDGRVKAADASGSVRWTAQSTTTPIAEVVVAPDGTVCFFDQFVFVALNGEQSASRSAFWTHPWILPVLAAMVLLPLAVVLIPIVWYERKLRRASPSGRADGTDGDRTGGDHPVGPPGGP